LSLIYKRYRPAFAEAPARRTRLWQAGLPAGRSKTLPDSWELIRPRKKGSLRGKIFFLTKEKKYIKKERSRLVETKSSYRKLVALFFMLICGIDKLQLFQLLINK